MILCKSSNSDTALVVSACPAALLGKLVVLKRHLQHRTPPTRRASSRFVYFSRAALCAADAASFADSPRASPRSSPEVITLNDETERKERIARLRRELDALTGEDDGGKAGPSGSKRVKREGDEERAKKKVKQEKTSSNAGKGKEKEVLVLSDSD